MAATDFPANPTTGQTYTANGRTWTWNGTAWVRSSPLIPSNPMSAIGDIIIGGSGGTPERLPVGANGTVATSNGTTVVWQAVTGTGTVTSVSVVTANGVSGSVANSTTAPAITLTLGDITPSKVETPEIKFPDPTSVNYIELAVTPAGLTDIRGVVFPDKDGTIALEGQHSHVASDIASMPANSVLVNPTTSTGTGQTVALSPSELLGRGSTGDVASITIGSNLVFSGTQLDLNSASVSITGGSIGGTTSINTTGSLTAAGTVSFTSATAGAVSTSADITVNGLRLGRGNSGAITSTAFGDRSLSSATGADNTAFGAEALRFATSSTLNVAFGGNSLRNLTSSSNNNSAIGVSAFRELTSGSSNNVAIGINAGRYQTAGDVNLTTCNNSVFIGAASRASANNQTNQVVIGGLAAIGDGSNTTVIGNTSTTSTRFAGTATSTAIISGNELRIANSATPTETEATVAGGIKWGADYLYVATATNTWKRIPLRSYSALIPISEGGTGASTAAGARANLGLETVVDDATTARTLASADAAKYIRFTSTSAITVTIPTNATDPIPIGSEYFIRRASTGAISLSNAGVTVNNSDIANLATGRVCCLKKVATDTWDYI